MTMSKVVETVSKKKIPSHVRSLVFEICCDDENGEDVEVPFVQYRLPRSTKWTHQLFEYSVIHQHQQPTKISCDLKKNLSSSTLNYSTIILIPCALSTTTMPTYFFFSFGVLFKCIPWHTAKILFESLVHCEYKNTKPNIEIKQSKLMYSVSNILQKMLQWMLDRCFLAHSSVLPLRTVMLLLDLPFLFLLMTSC